MQSPLHILFLCTWYPSRIFPTNGDFVQRHAHVVSRLHKVSVVHIVSDKNCSKKIEITVQKEEKVAAYIAYVRPTRNPAIKALRFLRAFRKLLRKIGTFDLVHLNVLYPGGILALYLKFLKKKRFIATEHWSGYLPVNSGKLSKKQLRMTRLFAQNASFICPVSRNLEESMSGLGIKGRYAVVSNVVDTCLFKPVKSSHKIFTIVHISDMSEDPKNVPGILRAISQFQTQVSDFQIKLIGGNPYIYEKLIADLNIPRRKVDLLKQLPHEEIVKHLQSASVFVLFSNYENQPCVILEAFACGVPVISTDVGGIAEIFPKDFGYLIPAKDENALAEKLISIARRSSAYPAELMHKYADKNFSPEAIAGKYDALYRQCILEKMNL